MRLTATTLRLMTDQHLLSRAHAQLDPLTSTALEGELLARFEALLIEHEATEALRGALDETGFDDATAAALLTAMADAGIDTPAALQARQRRLEALDALLNDHGDALADFITHLKE